MFHSRSRHSRVLAAAALAVVGALAFSACSASTPAAETSVSTEKKPLVISLDSSVDLLDPQFFRTPAAMVATGSIVDTLIEQTYEAEGIVNNGTTEFQPGIAESWTYSDDRTVLTFTLRDGLEFADGSPLTAADVVYTVQRAMTGPGYVKALFPIAGVTSTDMVVAVDDTTVQITTEYANPLLDKLIAMQPFGILSQESGEANATTDDPWAAKWFHDNTNSSGPYTVVSYDPTTSLVLEANPNYYDADKVLNSGITIQFVSDSSQRALLLRSGEIDLAQGIPLDQVAQFENEEGFTVVSEPSNRLEYLGFNTAVAPFDNALVRQAVAAAVPYEALQSDVLYGYANVATGVVPEGMDTYSADAGSFETDLDAAQDLLDESGVGEFETTLNYKQSSAVEERAAVFIQSSLAEIGITVNIAPLPDADFIKRTQSRDMPLYLNSFLGWGADPFYQMFYLASSGAGTNFTNYANADLDAQLKTGFQSADEDERAEISAAAQKVIYDDMPFVPVWNPAWTFVVRDGVAGLTKDNTEQLRLQYLTKE